MSHASSRIDSIREDAIALLEHELSDIYDNPTPSQTSAIVSEPMVCSSFLEHLITFSIFVGLFYAIFTAVSR